MSNVFKIRHNKDTHVYRTEVAGDKRNLLMQFRAIAEELAAKRRKEREGEHQRRKSMWGGGDVSQLPTCVLVWHFKHCTYRANRGIRNHSLPTSLRCQTSSLDWARSLT